MMPDRPATTWSAPPQERPRRLCIIVTAASTLHTLYRGQFAYWRQRGYEVLGVASPGPEHGLLCEEGVRTRAIAMARRPSPLRDVVSLVRLWWLLLRHRFDIVHVSTPKAALLGALAARLSGHRRVVYTLRGRAYENMAGLRHRVMAVCERLTCRLACRVIPICRELGQAVVAEGLCWPEKIRTIGAGSSNGVDLRRFGRTEANVAAGRQLRERLGLANGEVLVLFAGRIRREKGVNELVEAFVELAQSRPRAHLLLLGSVESADPLRADAAACVEKHPRIHRLAWLTEPAPAYGAADVVVLPSYREGFGNVCLEAAAMELPVVAADIMGCREAVARDATGLLVPPRQVAPLRDALGRLIDDASLRRRLGHGGRQRVEREFRQEIVWEGIARVYDDLLDGVAECGSGVERQAGVAGSSGRHNMCQ